MKSISEMVLFVQMKNIPVIKFRQGTIDLGANNMLIFIGRQQCMAVGQQRGFSYFSLALGL